MINNPSLRKAKYNGMSYEKKFELFCNSKGIGSIYYTKYSKSGKGQLFPDDRLLVKDFPYRSIYKDSICRTEFVLFLKNKRIRIEFKSQNKAGSTDEKIPYFLENVKHQFPENDIILAILGTGWKNGIKNYIENKIENISKNVKVFYRYEDLENYIGTII